MKESENNRPLEDSSAHVETALWKLGTEKPECRELVMSLITFMRTTLKSSIDPELRIDVEDTELARIIGGNIKRLRKKKGLSQKTVSEHLGITQGRISAMEAGEIAIKTLKQYLPKFAELFGVDSRAFSSTATGGLEVL